MPSKSHLPRSGFLVALVGAIAISAIALSMEAHAATKRILYFTIGPTPNAVEAAEIAKLQAISGQPFEVRVLNVQKAGQKKVLTADYLGGTIPPQYRDGGVDVGTPIYTVVNPSNPPRPNVLPSNQAVIYNGQSVSIAGGGSYVFNVASGALTSITYTKPDGGT